MHTATTVYIIVFYSGSNKDKLIVCPRQSTKEFLALGVLFVDFLIKQRRVVNCTIFLSASVVTTIFDVLFFREITT